MYEKEWERLRPIQVAAAVGLFEHDANVLISASTASGKTEAAFFPILTLLDENPSNSVGCLYIAPLKALINDQNERLNEVCERGGINVWAYHGDVSQSKKEKLMRNPSGILQITPESLESLLLNRHAVVGKLFGDLRFIVIDEIHSFMRSDRGGQTLCLIERLCRLAGVNPRRVGLSATIGDTAAVARWLGAGSGRKTIAPKLLHSEGLRWRLSVEHFYINQEIATDAYDRIKVPKLPEMQGGMDDRESKRMIVPKVPEEEIYRSFDNLPLEGLKQVERETTNRKDEDDGIGYIYEKTKGRKCLVFSNSREECEAVTAALRQMGARRGDEERFLIHHGNLSAPIRESAEEQMKGEEGCETICATSTLELGIDVGKLERAFQLGAPFTVSSFLQRMGRTGRRGEPSEMWFVEREAKPEERALLPQTLPWSLLQAISLIQLYREEHWVEPPQEKRIPYSLLYHQTMSILASEGEMLPRELAAKVLGMYAFRKVTQEDYKLLLQHLLAREKVEKTERGGLIVGLRGGKEIRDYRFLAVFEDNKEYSVRNGSQELGTIVNPPPVGDKIAIAGRVWEVEEIDLQRHVVYCHKVEGIIPAYFGECAGDIHTKILQRMRKTLMSDDEYPYIQEHALERLREARLAARKAGIRGEGASLVNLGGRMYCLFPWLGSYGFMTLERLIRIKCADRLGLKGFKKEKPYYMFFTMNGSEADFWRVLREEYEKVKSPLELVYPKETPVFEKYDEEIPEALLRKGFAEGVLDLDEARGVISYE